MKTLLKPVKKLGIKNKLALAPMTRCLCNSRGLPNKKMENYYLKQAKSGFGLIIIESAAINGTDALGYKNGLQFHSPEHLNYWSKFIKKFKRYGCKIIIQLFHSGRLTVKKVTGGIVLSPSAIKPDDQISFWRRLHKKKICHFQTNTEFKKPKKMSKNEINRVINQFKDSSDLAIKAGFDGIEIHGAHGYLVHCFNTYHTNRRKDEFKYTNLKFVKKLIKECKSTLGNKILSYRLSIHMVDNYYIRYSKRDYNIKKLVQLLDKLGVNIFHCSEIKFQNKIFNHNKSLFEEIRSTTKKTIIACGGISNFEDAKKCLKNRADMVAIGRVALINLNILNKLKSKKTLKKNFSYNEWQKL